MCYVFGTHDIFMWVIKCDRCRRWKRSRGQPIVHSVKKKFGKSFCDCFDGRIGSFDRFLPSHLAYTVDGEENVRRYIVITWASRQNKISNYWKLTRRPTVTSRRSIGCSRERVKCSFAIAMINDGYNLSTCVWILSQGTNAGAETIRTCSIAELYIWTICTLPRGRREPARPIIFYFLPYVTDYPARGCLRKIRVEKTLFSDSRTPNIPDVVFPSFRSEWFIY